MPDRSQICIAVNGSRFLSDGLCDSATASKIPWRPKQPNFVISYCGLCGTGVQKSTLAMSYLTQCTFDFDSKKKKSVDAKTGQSFYTTWYQA
ncbi:MAG: hypothetical protein JRN52_03630 [Nitrososphaerota archaeon]|nr:hypothetical protein [Nitrososphaerota archaeon]